MDASPVPACQTLANTSAVENNCNTTQYLHVSKNSYDIKHVHPTNNQAFWEKDAMGTSVNEKHYS